MSDDLPYLVEYAKTGRASCKLCKSPISNTDLRIATLTQSPFHDGKMQKWFHPNCFFQKQRPKTVGDIANFDNIRYEDQQFIKNKLAEIGSSAAPAVEGKGRKRGKAAALNKDLTVEPAKSSRSRCNGCEEVIIVKQLRIGKKDFDSEEGRKFGGLDRWYHVDCFVKLRQQLQFDDDADTITGFNSLSDEDKDILKSKLKKVDAADAPSAVKKPKLDKEDAKEEQLIHKQNKKMFSYKDKLSELSKSQLVDLLKSNKQSVPEGCSSMVDLLADIMTFGALDPCPQCRGQLIYTSGMGYKCTGTVDEWTKCENVIPDPKRKKFFVPAELKGEIDFSAKSKFKVERRAFKVVVPSVSSAMKKEDSVDGPKVAPSGPRPLKNMEFFLHGLSKAEKDSLQTAIMLLGGSVSAKLHENIVAVISTPKEIKRMNAKIKEAKELDIHVVSTDFVEEAKEFTDPPVMLINKKSICDWGANPSTRIANCTLKSAAKSGKSKFEKSSSGKVKVCVKGGGAVDASSGLQDIAHVYERNQVKYTVTFGITDIQTKKNSYYKMQILKHDEKKKFWFFRSWGRIGTTIGGNKLEDRFSLESCINKFQQLYKEKTCNTWGQPFHKVPGKMCPLELDEAPEESSVDLLHSNIQSKLAKPVQELLELIFDEELMKRAMMEFEIDTEKMPLGKLSKRQIQNAYQVLSDLLKLIKSGNAQRTQLIGKSNQFYTLVPHDFGVADPTIIDNEELVKTKSQMLESLLEIEVAYSLLHSKTDESVNPLDAHYDQLKTDIEVLDRESEEFKMIQLYAKNTHAQTHRQYELEIENVFKVKRQGEDERYRPFRKLPNKKLLWHGSRTTNFVGILSQGLRIAPPEAPVTGYMFGKGIYFADMVSKSANYCCTSNQNPNGLLLLCEVALGNPHDCYHADYIEKLPTDKHSTFAHGKTEPDPSQTVKIAEGVEVPLGLPKLVAAKKQNQRLDLLYNEYIVYDVAQVKVDYLVNAKFHYKY